MTQHGPIDKTAVLSSRVESLMESGVTPDVDIKDLTTDAVKLWLLNYAWLGTADEQAREVECIMAQADVVSIVDALTEKFRGQAWDDEQATEAQGFALSSLYECHDAPHLATCPRSKPETVAG